VVFTRIVVFIIALVIGICLMHYNEWLVRTVGKAEYAERILGSGGSYTMWKILGVIVIILGVIYLLGVI